MIFHLDRIIISNLLLVIAVNGCLSMEQEHRNINFEKEQEIFNQWVRDNSSYDTMPNPMFIQEAEDELRKSIEQRISSSLTDTGSHAIYILRNINGGLYNIFLINFDKNNWNGYLWKDKEEISIHDLSIDKDWYKQIIDNTSDTFQGDLLYLVIDGASEYLFVWHGNQMIRVAVYGHSGYPTKEGNGYMGYMQRILELVMAEYE